MAATRDLVSATFLLVLVASLQAGTVHSQSQTCTSQLSALNVCGPYVVPGVNTAPNTECCQALQAVGHDCLCSTMRIASQLPSQCNIPAASCIGE